MQWIKNLTAVAWVAAEALAPSPAPCSGLKDPALLLLLLQHRSQLWLRSDPWPRNSTYVGAAKKKRDNFIYT